MAVNFSKNQDEIIKAWREVVETPQASKWALFGYEGNTNNIRVMSTGSNGLKEVVQELNCSLIQYAFCRVIDNEKCINKLVLINWQGDSAPLSRKGLCASHVGDVTNYFKGCAQTITIRNDDESNEEYLMEQIVKTSSSKMNLSRETQQSSDYNSSDTLSNRFSSYKKTDISSELGANRKSFWQRQEEEEKERIETEKKRTIEKQAQFERERTLREESEAKKLAETIMERDRLIEATRQADRRESNNGSAGGSQPNSMLSSTSEAGGADDDDGRVGRRSELIRLERNQETQSLISKGLIKNKRAIFEQQADQQRQQQQQPTLTRRTSGTIVERMNAFEAQQQETTGSTNNSNRNDIPETAEKLANGFAKKVNISKEESTLNNENSNAVKREIATVTLTNDEPLNPNPDSSVAHQGLVSAESKYEQTSLDPKADDSPDKRLPGQNTDIDEELKNTSSQDVNGNENRPVIKSMDGDNAANIQSEEVVSANGKHEIRAMALFDYQAGDNTEISFDPQDLIGCIQKVDPGWWHGKVLSGKYKGQTGLFPANHVEEL